MTAKPSKCTLANRHVEFPGHTIGSGTLSLKIDKVEAIRRAKPPQNKTQIVFVFFIYGICLPSAY